MIPTPACMYVPAFFPQRPLNKALLLVELCYSLKKTIEGIKAICDRCGLLCIWSTGPFLYFAVNGR